MEIEHTSEEKFLRIKKTVDEITILTVRKQRVEQADSEFVLRQLGCDEMALNIDLGNTRVLLKQITDKLLEDTKKLLEYEIQERKKFLISPEQN